MSTFGDTLVHSSWDWAVTVFEYAAGPVIGVFVGIAVVGFVGAAVMRMFGR